MEKLKTPQILDFHAHIYFENSQFDIAGKIQQQIKKDLQKNLTYIGELINRPIGPHPLPMFEIDFSTENFERIVTYLMIHRESLSVLIHPQSGNDLYDHSQCAMWLGKQLELNYSVF